MRQLSIGLLFGILGGLATYNGAPLLPTMIIVLSLNIAANIVCNWYAPNGE